MAGLFSNSDQKLRDEVPPKQWLPSLREIAPSQQTRCPFGVGRPVANEDANRLGRRDSRKLAATATGNSDLHYEACVSRGQIGVPQRLQIAASTPLRPSAVNLILCMLPR
jgi:hypothetical protein